MHLESKTILLLTVVIDFKLQFKENVKDTCLGHVTEIHLPTLGQEEIS